MSFQGSTHFPIAKYSFQIKWFSVNLPFGESDIREKRLCPQEVLKDTLGSVREFYVYITIS